MKILVTTFAILLTSVSFSVPSFADQSEDQGKTMAAQYQAAAEELQNKAGSYPTDPASIEQFYADQKQKLDQAEAQFEIAHQAGHISDADYKSAKKSIAETREFIMTEGKNLGPQMAAANQAAAPIIAAHNACQHLQEDPQGYQACVQSKIQ